MPDFILYDVNSGLIAVLVFAAMLGTVESGFHLGQRKQRLDAEAAEASKAHITAVQTAMLSILALLLGFTFSLSLQRFDSRSEAVVHEANAISTAYLRTQLLAPGARPQIQQCLREYVDIRVKGSELSTVDPARLPLLTQAGELQNRCWELAVKAAELDPNSLRSGLLIRALNDMIDSFVKRDAALQRHVPELILILLFATFLMAGLIVGYASGMGKHRPSFASYVMIGLMVVLIFIILDLDRPRRGVINVSQSSLMELQKSMHR